MPWKRWLASNLVLLIVGLLVTVVAAMLAALLHAGGDESGAAAVRGVAWVGVAVTTLSALGQLLLLSLIQLSPTPTSVETPPHPASTA